MTTGGMIRLMFAMTALAPFAQGCEGSADPSDPVTTSDGALRVIGDPGDIGDSPPPPPRPPRPPAVPQFSDLESDGTMRFWMNANGRTGVSINVINIGSIPATAASGTVNVAGHVVSGPLSQYTGGTATTANTLNAGELGFIMVELPAGVLAPCRGYAIQIDTTRVMQRAITGAIDVFANDQARANTPCLEWDSTLTSHNNYYANAPLVRGNTLMEIVSSQKVGRTDGRLCSHCHYTGSGLPYSPPVVLGGSAPIGPYDVINGRTWAGPGGYARSFLAQPTDDPTARNSKPYYLQEVVRRWIEDGERISSRVADGDPPPAAGW